jgi:ABC-type dipeptide/oligopeptide/nickel transport system permease subunit
MLGSERNNVFSLRRIWCFFPGIAILVTVLAFNLLRRRPARCH